MTVNLDNDENAPVTPNGFVLGKRAYEVLKFVALVLLPALGTLYFTLGAVWNLPNVEQVIGTITAVDTFLGILLRVSTSSYNNSPMMFDGHIAIHKEPSGKTTFSLELDDDPETIIGKDKITFRVGKP